MTTGQRIKAARKKAGMTQVDLSQKLDIPFQSISQWERDIRNPKYETLQRIAAALDVEPWELMEYDGSIRVSPPSGQPEKPLKESLDGLMSTLEKVSKTFPADDKLNWALPRLTDGGKNKVADYALDLVKISEYRRQDAPEPSAEASEGTCTTPPPEGTEGPPEGE